MTHDARFLVVLSDALEVPPVHGYHVHLLALARAVSASVPTKVFAWGERDSDEGLLSLLDRARAPRGRYARKRRYLDRACAWIDAHAGPGSVLWVRTYVTGLLLLPYLRARRRRGLVAVYDASSFLRLEARDSGSPLSYAVRGFVEERLWPHFDRIRTLTDPMRDYLVSRGVPERKIFVAPVGAARPDRWWQPRGEPTRLLYIGSAMGWQGLPELLAAMRLVGERRPGVRLSVVGADRRAFPAGQVPDNVDFHGHVPHAGIAEFYLGHDLFVLPRPRTRLTDLVLPMKLPEAMSFGIPILATDLGAARWALGENGAVLVADNSPETLARGILGALADPAPLARLGARARARAARFAWDAVGRGIASALLAAGRGSGVP